MIVAPLDLVRPLYSVHRFTDEIYKIVKYKGELSCGFRLSAAEHEHYENKLDASFSRARRMVLEYALCNTWDFFFTGTFNPNWYDRFNLSALDKSLKQWFRDMRKKYSSPFAFLLVPEQHKDGAWHFHGLLYGIPSCCLSPFDPAVHPLHLCHSGYLNFSDFSKKFGYCSLAPVRDPVATAFYMTKYISKDLSARSTELYKHLYSASRGLNVSALAAEASCPSAVLDSFLTHRYQFCDVGFTRTESGCDWTFPLEFDDRSVMPLFDSELVNTLYSDPSDDFEQLYFWGE